MRTITPKETSKTGDGIACNDSHRSIPVAVSGDERAFGFSGQRLFDANVRWNLYGRPQADADSLLVTDGRKCWAASHDRNRQRSGTTFRWGGKRRPSTILLFVRQCVVCASNHSDCDSMVVPVRYQFYPRSSETPSPASVTRRQPDSVEHLDVHVLFSPASKEPMHISKKHYRVLDAYVQRSRMQML